MRRRAHEAQERRPAMEYGAIDLHKKESQIRIVTKEGEVIDRRIATTRAAFQTMFWGRAPMRVLLEASTESEWVAQHLEGMGHEGDRRGSELRADVWAADAADEDRPPGCGGADGGVPAGDVSGRASAVGGAARRAAAAPDPAGPGAESHRRDLDGAGDDPGRWPADPHERPRDVSHAAQRPGAVTGAHRHAGPAPDHHCHPERGSRDDRRGGGRPRPYRPGGQTLDDLSERRRDYREYLYRGAR